MNLFADTRSERLSKCTFLLSMEIELVRRRVRTLKEITPFGHESASSASEFAQSRS